MAWRCGNPNCPRYGGTGYRLGDQERYIDGNGRVHCTTCNWFVAKVEDDEQTAKAVAGATGGALVGWAVGGPPGALIGGMLGFLSGLAAGEKKNS
jgi:hypothetical protein